MKRKISVLLLSMGLVVGFVFAYNELGFNKRVRALDGNEIHLDLETEYAKDEEVEKTVKLKVMEFDQEAITVDKLQVNDNLNRQYRVETVERNGIMSKQGNKIAENVYMFNVKLKDSNPPIIEGNNATIATGGEFDISALGIRAYDKVDGDLTYEVKENNVDTSTAGSYKVVVVATDHNNLKTQKEFAVTVENGGQGGNQNGYTDQNDGSGGNGGYTGYTTNNTPTSTVSALDRNNLYVRGWKIVANDYSVSDATIRAYMNELANLPGRYDSSLFTTVTIDLSLPYPYLGMAYSDGRLWLNGSGYYSTTVLHEATHAYDFKMGFNSDPALIQAFNAEKNNIPAKFSGNMRDDTYEWVANLVVYYYYDPGTLSTYAPQSYNYVKNVILR